MLKRELKKLSRADLIEMMLDLSKENERLRESLAKAQKKLEDQTIAVDKAGSLAEAALSLNGVFEAAQAAANQYLQNIRQWEEQQKLRCMQPERDTGDKRTTQKLADDYVQKVNATLRERNEPDCQETSVGSGARGEV